MRWYIVALVLSIGGCGWRCPAGSHPSTGSFHSQVPCFSSKFNPSRGSGAAPRLRPPRQLETRQERQRAAGGGRRVVAWAGPASRGHWGANQRSLLETLVPAEVRFQLSTVRALTGYLWSAACSRTRGCAGAVQALAGLSGRGRGGLD